MQFPPEAYHRKIKMPTNETEKQYNDLKKKLKLPEFRELDFEFEISDLEETNYLLRSIVRKIAEKLDFYTTILEEILQPDTSNLYAMHEMSYFEDDEKKRMYDLYCKLMNLNRRSIEVSLEHDPGNGAQFITESLSEWKTLKNEMLEYVRKMKNSWKKEADKYEDVGYLG